MTQFLARIPSHLLDACYGAKNTLSLAYNKLTTTAPWKKTVGVATPYFRSAVERCPKQVRSFVFSKQLVAGAGLVIALGGIYNWWTRRK